MGGGWVASARPSAAGPRASRRRRFRGARTSPSVSGLMVRPAASPAAPAAPEAACCLRRPSSILSFDHSYPANCSALQKPIPSIGAMVPLYSPVKPSRLTQSMKHCMGPVYCPGLACRRTFTVSNGWPASVWPQPLIVPLTKALEVFSTIDDLGGAGAAEASEGECAVTRPASGAPAHRITPGTRADGTAGGGSASPRAAGPAATQHEGPGNAWTRGGAAGRGAPSRAAIVIPPGAARASRVRRQTVSGAPHPKVEPSSVRSVRT